ncbi:hypothetical protein SAMN05444920_111172 [Nonomuraea solani]|uniref:Uncharacterized protein n=1 Tax=Nonomuraea solani TaxID=1144553 RepID=A0A1H6EL56_9ACTN|nr:hypothetical protein SAMN05444920_111172 [Nonomuraea solani]
MRESVLPEDRLRTGIQSDTGYLEVMPRKTNRRRPKRARVAVPVP